MDALGTLVTEAPFFVSSQHRTYKDFRDGDRKKQMGVNKKLKMQQLIFARKVSTKYKPSCANLIIPRSSN